MKVIVKCSECKKVLFKSDNCPKFDSSKIKSCSDCDSKKIDVDIR